MSTLSAEERLSKRPPREQQAWDEVGHTEFAPGVRTYFIALFLVCILVVPLVQILMPASSYAGLKGESPAAKVESDLPKGSGVVTAISERPVAGAVYKDFVMTFRIDQQDPAEVVEVRVLGMDDRVMTAASRVSVGDQVTYSYQDWNEVSEAKGSLKTAGLDDTDLLNPPPMLWAESLEPVGGETTGSMAFLGDWDGGLSAAGTAWAETDGGLLKSFLAGNARLGRSINHYEDSLDDNSWLTLAVKSPFQAVFVRLKVGNEKAYVGRDGWLFFEPGVKALTGRGFLDAGQLKQRSRSGGGFTDVVQPDPRVAILQFHEELKARGIELVLIPTPVKPTIHPEYLTPRLNDFEEVLRNRSFDTWKEEMIAAGVKVLDPGAMLKERALADGPQYLATDTHWRPESMLAVASMVADELKTPFDSRDADAVSFEEAEKTQIGDIGVMLELPEGQTAVDPETVNIRRVLKAGAAWKPTRGSDVLLLGDSFTNIYSVEAMGWGSSAGFAEQLSAELGRPIDRISRNDAGAFATREILVDELAADPTRLDGVKTIVWQFAERELAVGNWKVLGLSGTEATAPEGEEEVVALVDPAPTPVEDVSSQDPVAPSAEGVLVENLADQDALAVMAKLANEDFAEQPAFAAADSWLFLRDELRHMGTGKFWGADANPTRATKNPDPFAAIVDLKQKLEELNIELILMPAPPRAAIYPDKIMGGLPLDENGIPKRIDVHHQQFYKELQEAGVKVIDLTDDFLEARKTEATDGPVCLTQDTHWSTRGVEIATKRLKEALADVEWPADAPSIETHLLPVETLEVKGDLVDRVPEFGPSNMSITVQRASANGQSFSKIETNSESPLLMLTDSHGLVFHSGGDMLMEGAGISDKVAHELGMSVDLMAMRGSGSSVRRELARRFLLSNDEEKKRVLVYVFAARAFTESRNWSPVPLQR